MQLKNGLPYGIILIVCTTALTLSCNSIVPRHSKQWILTKDLIATILYHQNMFFFVTFSNGKKILDTDDVLDTILFHGPLLTFSLENFIPLSFDLKMDNRQTTQLANNQTNICKNITFLEDFVILYYANSTPEQKHQLTSNLKIKT